MTAKQKDTPRPPAVDGPGEGGRKNQPPAPPPDPIDVVAEFLVQGQATYHIVQYLETQRMTPDAAVNCLREALNKFVKVAQLPAEVRLGWLTECSRELFRSMKKTGDYAGALRALQFIAELHNSKRSKTDSPPPKEQTDDEIDQFIKNQMEL